MIRRIAFASFAIVVAAVAGVLHHAWASPPVNFSPPTSSDPPSNHIRRVQPENQDSIEQAIRQALEGEPLTRASGDGVLDDVLEVIRSRGSILDGTTLDPVASRNDNPTSLSRISARARASEQLLKAARLLESIGHTNPRQAELVGEMRAEAARLLSTE